jgi:hypothetical protein
MKVGSQGSVLGLVVPVGERKGLLFTPRSGTNHPVTRVCVHMPAGTRSSGELTFLVTKFPSSAFLHGQLRFAWTPLPKCEIAGAGTTF